MIIAGILLLLCCAGMGVLAVRKGMLWECAHTLAALGALVGGTRVTLATGWWGIVFFPLTFLVTGWTLLRGVRADG
jgi:hypothetical protein